eukprot:TRINITY_DN15059_c0_g2_i1.p1 TRINITY_DN15059_c0_g2~~TRINITY_DN15059_c0_g2_i1.p1  ORF type:complete len:161 (+),score=21.30 TRINITY_DN15059_c0_g2_i1:257-739(+)
MLQLASASRATYSACNRVSLPRAEVTRFRSAISFPTPPNSSRGTRFQHPDTSQKFKKDGSEKSEKKSLSNGHEKEQNLLEHAGTGGTEPGVLPGRAESTASGLGIQNNSVNNSSSASARASSSRVHQPGAYQPELYDKQCSRFCVAGGSCQSGGIQCNIQ